MEYNAPYTGENYREIARAMGVEGVDVYKRQVSALGFNSVGGITVPLGASYSFTLSGLAIAAIVGILLLSLIHIWLPGDLSSQSRFVRAAFTRMNSVSGCTEKESVDVYKRQVQTRFMT